MYKIIKFAIKFRSGIVNFSKNIKNIENCDVSFNCSVRG